MHILYKRKRERERERKKKQTSRYAFHISPLQMIVRQELTYNNNNNIIIKVTMD